MPPNDSGGSRPKHPRPPYVTRICVSLLLCGAAGLALAGGFIFSTMAGDSGDNTPVWVKCVYVALPLVVILCGGFMLRGANWARLLFYAAGAPIVLGVHVIAQTRSLEVPGTIAAIATSVVIVLAYCIALSMDRANWFFKGRHTFFKKDRSRGWGGNRTGRDFDY